MNKGIKYAILAAAAYELAVGVSELLWVSTQNKTLAKIAGYPSVASAVDGSIAASFPQSAHNIEGAIDVAIAAIAGYIALK